MARSSRRTFIKAASAAAAASTVAACDAPATNTAQGVRITGSTESRFPSAEAPGSNDGGYNKRIREMLSEIRFRPATRPDGRPVLDTAIVTAEAPRS